MHANMRLACNQRRRYKAWATHPGTKAMDQAVGSARTLQQGSQLKTSEVLPRTSRTDEMKAWQHRAHGVGPSFGRTPDPAKPLDLGAEIRAPGLRRIRLTCGSVRELV